MSPTTSTTGASDGRRSPSTAKPYELVTLDDLTLDEAIVVWEYAKLSLDQIPDLEGFHPGVVAALIHIAVARGEPGEIGEDDPADGRPDQGRPSCRTSSRTSARRSKSSLLPQRQTRARRAAGSGETSPATSGPPPEPSQANGSGSPGSDTGAISDPVTSAA